MNPDRQDVYLIREEAAADESGWLAPEPADEVIVAEVLEASALSREDVEPLGDHLDFEQLYDVLAGDSAADELTFSVEGVTVTVSVDGSVTVSS